MNSILDARPMVSIKKQSLILIFLFNCENGVIDLKQVNSFHTIAIYCLLKYLISLTTKMQIVHIGCDSWKVFSLMMMGQLNHEIIDFLQKSIGYTLTGDISEQVMFFLYGTGRNGKSTFINTIQNLLGDYGRQTNSDTFIKKKNDNSINNDIARLRWRSFCLSCGK
jgi:putative DNA primase/helicase